MEENKKKVLILGGTGFLGYHVIRAFSESGFELGVMLHNKTDDLSIPYDGYKTFTGDIAKPASIERVINEFRPDIIIHLVGIMREKPPQKTYKKLHVEGTQNIVEAVKKAGIPDEKIIYVSALGADLNGSTEYYRTKAQAEEIIKNSGLVYAIFRPAIIFGWRAHFTNRLRFYARILPFIPVISKNTFKLEPVAADTVADVIVQAANGAGNNKTYNVVGPEFLTARELTERLREKMGSVKPIVRIPIFIARIATMLGSLGLPTPVTKPELVMLLSGDEGTNDELKKDFEVKDIYFDPINEYPLY
ncbi:MAG: NAD-dependent epimerase/dehydratase family protein [Candidatus Spechtbacterales bacterium]